MNSTNRFLNRLFVFLIGLILLVGGAAVSAGVIIPDIQKRVSGAAKDASGSVSDTLSAQPWILWVAAAAALVLVILLIVFILRQGRGHTSTMLRVGEGSGAGTPTGGSILLDVKVGEQLLTEALSHEPGILSVDVTGFQIRKQEVLRVTAHARRGTSPMQIRSAIDSAVAELDAALGATTPVVIQIVSGLRTRMSSTTRVA